MPPHRQLTGRWWGFVLVATGAALWGTGGIAGVVVADHSAMSWPAISSLRLFGGGLVMLVATLLSGELRRLPRTRSTAGHVGATAVLTAVFGTAYFSSVPMVGVAVATVVSLGSAPVAVAVASAVLHRRWPERATVGALVVALVGLVLVTGGPDAGTASGEHPVLGALLALLSGLAFGAATLLNSRSLAGMTPAMLIGTSFTLAGLLGGTLALWTGYHVASMTPLAWLGIAHLVVFQSVLGYLCFYAGLRRGVSATAAAILSLVEPLAAAALSVSFLDEPFTLAIAAGMALLLAAVLLVRPTPVGEGAIVVAAEGSVPTAASGGRHADPHGVPVEVTGEHGDGAA